MCSIIFPLQIEAYYSDLDSDDPTVGTTSELLTTEIPNFGVSSLLKEEDCTESYHPECHQSELINDL